MIDHTSTRIEEHRAVINRQNRRRYAFLRMLQATDRLLWRLEELNRDGVKTVPRSVRGELQQIAGSMPAPVREGLRDSAQVQDALDSVFEVQERLFRWRFPNWHDWDPDSGEYDKLAG